MSRWQVWSHWRAKRSRAEGLPLLATLRRDAVEVAPIAQQSTRGAFWCVPPREMLCYAMPCCAMRRRSLPWPARGDTRPRVPSGAQMNTRRAHFSSSRAALRRLRKQLYRAQLLLDVLLRRERLKHQLAMMQQAIELIK